jgi:penicillin-binding protein 1B
MRNYPLFRIALIAVSLVVLCLLAKFWYVDASVQRRLSLHNRGSYSMVYYRPIRYVAGQRIVPSAMRSRLVRRAYSEVTFPPKRAGEFRCSESLCTFRPRVHTPINQKEEVKAVTIRFGDGKITNDDGELLDYVDLEPLPLSTLGEGEVRAITRLELDEISPHVVNAVLSTEDQRFYSHWGVDPIGIGRAIAKNIVAGSWVEGGSTITQQLAKNVLLSPKKTLGRKFNELFAALSLERQLSKTEILTMYLNEVYFSQEGSVAIHGIQEAAKTFFGKDAKDLTAAQSALLIGLIKAPSYYSPRRHLERSLVRRNIVLKNMLELESLSPEDFKKAKVESVKLSNSTFQHRDAPYYMSELERELEKTYQIEPANRSGLQVSTFIDEEFQLCAEKAVANNLSQLEKTFPALKSKTKGKLQQALVAIDAKNGEILAWVGGRDYHENQFDHVSQARRQIGSTIKPFLYLTAMDPSLNTYKVATPISILGDEPTDITILNQANWQPKNYDHKYHGDVTLRYALERSLNIPAVYVAQRVGIHNVKITLDRFKVAPSVQEVPALALGALDTSLLDLTASFAGLSQLGSYTRPRLFKDIEDPDGTLLAATPFDQKQVTSKGPVFLVLDILRGVVERGTGKAARSAGYKGPAAGKTGTSNESRDAWFVGFTPRITVGVWTGFDDNRKTGLTGSNASAPVWGSFMECISPHIEPGEFNAPPSISIVSLDSRNRKRFHSYCAPDAGFITREVFLKGTEPRFQCFQQGHFKDKEYQDQVEHRMRRRNESFWDSLWN